MILQGACLVFSGGGIVIEYFAQESMGLYLITFGSICFAVSTKIHKLALVKRHKKELNQKSKDHE